MSKKKFYLASQKQRFYKIKNNVFDGRNYGVLTSSVLSNITDRIHYILDKASKDAIFDSLRGYVGSELTKKEETRLSYKLAAVYDLLREGVSISLNDNRQTVKEIVAAKITKVRRVSYYKFRIYFFIFTGSQAGNVVEAEVFSKELRRQVLPALGFNYKKYRFGHWLELANLDIVLKLEPNSDSKPIVTDYYEHSTFISNNRRDVMALRFRYKPCPRDFENPCYDCVIGYMHCPGGVHKENYKIKRCIRCQEEKPHHGDDAYCVTCERFLDFREGKYDL